MFHMARPLKRGQDREGDGRQMFDIQEELKKLPGKPGVYIMHDEKDTAIFPEQPQQGDQD